MRAAAKVILRVTKVSTSELYGKVEEVPQNENTPFHPYSPYAVAKQYGFWIVKEYREAYDMSGQFRSFPLPTHSI